MRRAIVIVTASLLAAASGAHAAPFTLDAEALWWQYRGNPTPPLVSTGILGEPGTRVLMGGDDLDTNPNLGLRLTGTYALADLRGVEASILYVPTRRTTQSVASSGQPGSTDIFVPVFDASIHAESVENISAAGFFAGDARAELANSLLGVELNATRRLETPGTWRVDGLGGLRYLRLRETFTFSTDSPNIPPEPADVYQTTDRFGATNDFFGVQLGVRARHDWGPWSASGSVKLGIGAMVQDVDIEGSLLTNAFNGYGTPVTYSGGGYFATPTNIGGYRRNVFAVVPEVALAVSYRLSPATSIFAGYTFLYASNVVRAPHQVNRTVNYTSPDLPPGLPLGPQEPSFGFKSSSFRAQALGVGITVRF